MNKKTAAIIDEIKIDPEIPANAMLEILSIIAKYKKFIFRFIIICTIGTILVALLSHKWYKSTASVFPAEKADLLGGLEGIASLAKSFSPAKALTSLSGNSETDRYFGDSQKQYGYLMAIIQKFDLVHEYDITDYPIEKTTKELLSNVDFKVEDEGNITITVYDRDPQRAADMANYFVELLNKTNTELQGQNARGNRLFIEERYKKNIVDLDRAEDSLKAFQKINGVVALPEQTEASIKALAEISGQLALKEVQANVLRRTQSAENPTLVATQIEIDELRNKISQMNKGTGVPQNEMKMFVPFSKMPDLGGEYVRWYRDVEIQYKILQFITPLYEQAKVEEQRQTPSVIILDRAVPAERKAKPKILLYALIAVVSSLLLALVAVFSLEAIKRIKSADPERFDALIMVTPVGLDESANMA